MLIGVIVCGLVEDYAINLVKSIEQMAGDKEAKCVIIPVKFLELDYEKVLRNKYGYCYNSLVSYGLLSCFDGLIIEMASVLMYADDEAKKRYAAMFDGIPHVFISYDKDGASSVSIDNQAGLVDALEYMYSNGATKYAMLGGTPNNVDSLIRKDCFENFIKKHNLFYNEKSYQDGSFFLPCEKEAETLVRNNMDADVFVCANDFLATHIYKALRKVGKRPGKDVSVLGFDDSAICTLTYPSISSVRTDITEVGRASVELLLELIKKNTVRQTIIPSRFILRDSICHREQSEDALLKEYNFDDYVMPNILEPNKNQLDKIESIIVELSKMIDGKDGVSLDDLLEKIYLKLDDLFSCEGLDSFDWERFLVVINARYKRWLHEVSELDAQQKITDLFIKFQEFVLMANHYTTPEKMYSDVSKNIGMEMFLRETMQFVRNAEANYVRFLKNVDFIGIKNAFLYLYEEPIFYYQGEHFEIPQYLYLKAILRDGKAASIDRNKQKIKREEMFDNEYVIWDSYSHGILFPVCSDNILYGVLLCDMNRVGFEQSDLFMNQIGSGIRMMNLRIENSRIVDEYEESVRKLKEYNITLDNMSKTDSLTGLNNRRGFFMRTDTVLGLFPDENVSVIIGYVDMNDLKMVNDKFGHDDGDFALKTIGSMLADFVTEYNGFAARIGGDEFAYIITVLKDFEIEQCRKELYGLFDEFNKKSIKPYNVEISIGDCVIEYGSNLTIEDALRQADERLYYEKSVRKKSSILKTLN